ncbi:hypothetical protein A0H81_13332 [Grifola frondosa]|uniref:Phosphatidylglycerol/phosphatidylinositol transfer protein n=1 Tax=Grifola frondosa TaxID=5627 RepID=A0A1C7LRM6_GRIFR|nr:hypothetical protein A0H81_13332 [Grifola frondosa]
MKLLSFLACFTASALAQRIAIGAPARFSTVARGSNITVEVDKPNALTGSKDIAIVIGLVSCNGHEKNECASFDVTQVVGQILYSGPYKPQYETQQPGVPFKPPYQNFTVQVPATFQKGQASLSVSHFSLVGAGPYPFLDVQNTTLIVQSA